MFNFYFGVGFTLVNFILFLLCYKWFGKAGLFAWIAAATILANLQVVKTIEMFGLVMTLGNVIYGTIYLATDLLNEKYGEKEAKKAVWFGFFTLVMTTIIMQLVLVFEPHESDFAQTHLEALFGLMPRLALGSLTAYLVSQYLDVKLFAKLREKFSRPDQLWIRNNGSTMVSQLIDTFIFCMIAFAGVFSWDVWVQIFFTTYVIKFVVSAASTPFIYIARGFKHTEETQKPGF
ncbi:queuosine precursor transporter [Fictibacillus nanhaiensis]|uniref:queuosine precursor transporter n=1 Tax=Fictibacillus nanhaiensis TaxID=742169 RepID=UPI0020425857|nr:queuosine precursor transporter [Fictibacillus nanhaiensis]MCM3731911.1 queuosine precursor transporter [Fictibacillus nanhaiensis]